MKNTMLTFLFTAIVFAGFSPLSASAQAGETYLRVNSEVETSSGLTVDSFRAEIKPDFSNTQKDSTIIFAFTFRVGDGYKPFSVRIGGASQSAQRLIYKVDDPTSINFSNFFIYARQTLIDEYGWDVDIVNP